MKKIPLFKILPTDQWVRPYLRKYRKDLVFALFLGFATFFFGSALMFNSGFLISKSASLPTNILLVYIPIVLTRLFGIGRPVLRYLERLTSHNWVLKMTSKLRVKLYQSLEKNAIFIKQEYRFGDVMGLLAEDINHLQNLYLRTIFPTIVAWLLYAVVILVLGYFSWFFALFFLLYMSLFLFLFPMWSLMVNGIRQEDEKKIRRSLYTDLTDNVLGVSDWVFSQRSQDYVRLHEASQAKLASIQDKIRKFNHRRTLLLEVLFGLLVVILLIWSGRYFTGNHGGPANWIAAVVLSIFPLMEAFTGLSAASQETSAYSDSIRRLNELPAASTEDSPILLPNGPLDIVIDQLSFHYVSEEKPVLSQLSLEIKQGQKLAILGRSGSGKTTLAGLLRGDLLPTTGSITLGGLAVSDFKEKISDYMAVIQQAPYLFRTSLLNNVRLGNEAATEEQVWQALKQVGLKDMVASLPQGLDTMVDEAGFRFSGGERHRLALARVLLQDSPIVLLDEPTVGLDPVTEKALLNTFMAVLSDKTLIWITHHLKGIEAADKVIFIENGQLEMEGSPAELYQTSQHYRQLKALDDGEEWTNS